MRLLEAPEVLRAAGLPVTVLDGYAKRGAELQRVDAIVEHCTVTPGGRTPLVVAQLLRDGHSTLKGPLSQFGHDDSGRWWCVAAGRCSHNGYGTFGNEAIGVEKMHPNTSAWPYLGLDSWVRGSAALAAHYGVHVNNIRGHRETDPRRKSDPLGLDLAAFRRAVLRVISNEGDEDDMTPEQAERQKRIEAKLDRIIDGVPAYGVPPLHEIEMLVVRMSDPVEYMRTTASRELRRNVRAVGEELGLEVRDRPEGDAHIGELRKPPEK